MDFRLELVLLPVADVDRAKAFYAEQLGWSVHVDHQPNDEFRVVQMDPPGSACSVSFGVGIGDPDRDPVQGTHLVVTDIVAARGLLVDRGVDVSEIRHMAEEGWQPGADPDHRDYMSFADFADPDGNTWVLQEVGHPAGPQDTGQPRGGRLLPQDWDASYDETPPWDIGRPQAPFVALAESGALHGRVLDLGCGTGEHALLAAAFGSTATGVDIAPTAIEQASAKALERGLDARFLARDALEMDDLGESFDVVLDSGFFHVLPDDARPRLRDMLGAVLSPGGTYFLLCFSDRVPGDDGPRRIAREEITDLFDGHGFDVVNIAEAGIEATFLDVPVPAWLATIVRHRI